MREHIIMQANETDLPLVYKLFEEAINFQKANRFIGWDSVDKAFIQLDIQSGQLFKVVMQQDVLGIFSICLKDELIWREREKADALYLHRVVVNRALPRQHLFSKVMTWAEDYAKQNRLRYIRIDTWAENAKIIAYYRQFGFTSIETYTTPDTTELPVQHRNLHVVLLQKPVRYSNT